MAIPVQVIRQDNQEPCSCCGSWLDHWKKSEGDHSPFCGDSHCLLPASGAVLVRRLDRADHELHVIPVCRHHKTNGMQFDTRTFLVPASFRPSCHSLSVVTQRVVPYPAHVEQYAL